MTHMTGDPEVPARLWVVPRDGITVDLDSNPVPCWVVVEGTRCEGLARDLVNHPSGWHVHVRYSSPESGETVEDWFKLDDVESRD